MRLGIIGSGKIGSTVARLAVDSGHEVAIANSRGPETLADLVGELGSGAGAETPEGAARYGDLVLVAIPFGRYEDLPVDELDGKVVIDATNYYPDRDGRFPEIDEGARGSSEMLSAHLPGSRIVKAFNTMYFETLAGEGRPDADAKDRLVLFVAGDSGDAKREVESLIDELGFTPVDTGGLAAGGRRQQPGTAVYNEPMNAAEAERALER